MPGGNIVHFGAVRYRVIGEGELKSTFIGLDNNVIEDLADLTLTPVNNREPIRLANFMAQRAKLHVSVDAIDEWFQFNTIILFVKPIYSSYPLE